MTKFTIKRVYEKQDPTDGYRVLADRLWPRGISKESLHYDLWAKELTPDTSLRKWFHEDKDNRWPEFRRRYRAQLRSSDYLPKFMAEALKYDTVTLLYASRDTVHTSAVVLREFLQEQAGK